MPRSTLLTVCAIQGRSCHATPDVAECVCSPTAVMSCHARRCRSCLFSKGDDGMPRPMSFNRVCCPKAMMACHARRRFTMCAFQRRRCHVSPDDADRVCYPRALMLCHARRCRPRVLSKGGDVMPRSTLPSMYAVKGRRFHATPDVAVHVCCPRVAMSFHARHYRPCVLSLGGDVMQRPTLPTVCVVQGR